MKCMECGKSDYRSQTISDEVELDGGPTVKVKALSALVCPKCGDVTMDAATSARRTQLVLAALVRVYGGSFQIPGKVAKWMRSAIDLSAVELAKEAGVDPSAFSQAAQRNSIIDRYAAFVLLCRAADYISGSKRGRDLLKATHELDKFVNPEFLSAGDLYKKHNNAWNLMEEGEGVPSGGTVGQVLTKIDSNDYNTQWSDVPGNYAGVESLVGFLDSSQVTLSINDTSRTLSVAPTGPSYTIFVGGIRINKTVTASKSWPNIEGLHYFYFDSSGVLQCVQNFDPLLITRYTIVSIVYWDVDNQKHIYWADERHGVYMEPMTHRYLHTTRGAQWDNGLRLENFIVDGGGSSNSHAQFSSSAGVIWDEDIRISIPAQTQIPVFYRLGLAWRRKVDNFPVVWTAGSRLSYNLYSGGSWSLAEVDNNKWVLVHVFATNDIDYPVVAIQGTNQYISKAAARTGAELELQSLSGLPFAEFAPLGSVIFETSSAYTNTPKAQIVSTDTGENYSDKRSIYFRPGTL